MSYHILNETKKDLVVVGIRGYRIIEDTIIETVRSKPRNRGSVFVENNSPKGILLQDIISCGSIPFWYEDRVLTNVNGEATVVLMKKGLIYTNCVAKNCKNLVGRAAYTNKNGILTTTENEKLKVGKFMTDKDESGYVRVYIDIQ